MIYIKYSIIFLFFVFTITNAKEPLAAFKLDSLWYVIDDEGLTMLNPLTIKSISAYSEGYFLVKFDYKGQPKQGFMTMDGQVAMLDFDEVRPFKEGMAAVGKKIDITADSSLTYYGYINNKGEMPIKPIYLEAFDFSDSLAWVMNFEKRGYIDKNGLFNIEYVGNLGFGNSFSTGFAAFVNDSIRFGYIDKNGKVVIDFRFDEAGDFVEEMAKVNNLGFWGYIDKKGQLIVKHSYDFANNFSEGFAFVGIPDTNMASQKWSLIAKSGARMFDFKYNDIRNFSEGMACVALGRLWKFIDPQDNQLINELFYYADSFKNGLAFVIKLDQKSMGFINPLGEMMVEIPVDASEVIDLRWNRKVK